MNAGGQSLIPWRECPRASCALAEANASWASYTPMSSEQGVFSLGGSDSVFCDRGCVLFSSHSFKRSTRWRHANLIRSSCSWIRSQEPLSVVLCRADHVSMRCRRRCVRNQRGTVLSVHSWGESEVLESGLKVIDHISSQIQAGGRSSASAPTLQP